MSLLNATKRMKLISWQPVNHTHTHTPTKEKKEFNTSKWIFESTRAWIDWRCSVFYRLLWTLSFQKPRLNHITNATSVFTFLFCQCSIRFTFSSLRKRFFFICLSTMICSLFLFIRVLFSINSGSFFSIYFRMSSPSSTNFDWMIFWHLKSRLNREQCSHVNLITCENPSALHWLALIFIGFFSSITSNVWRINWKFSSSCFFLVRN